MLVNAYAKVNLILNVLGKRPDGYHEIETFMQALPLCDEVEVNIKEGEGVLLRADNPRLNNVHNLAYAAAEKMLKRYKIKNQVSISINKNIPLAAGLAGGSADAAAVITALAKLWNINDLNELFSIGAQLGSDVPFCIAACHGYKAAIGRGRGEKLEIVDPVDCEIELLFSDIFLPGKTKAVYAELKPSDYEVRNSIEAFMKAESLEEKLQFMGNHLEAPARRVFKNNGYELPEGDYHLSGAGPTLFRIKKTR